MLSKNNNKKPKLETMNNDTISASSLIQLLKNDDIEASDILQQNSNLHESVEKDTVSQIQGIARLSERTMKVSRREYHGIKIKSMGDIEINAQRKRLPVYQYKEQLVNAVRFNQVVVVVGETGSGKSTQMPQYLLEAGLVQGGGGRIAITQPRRVAAVSVASRVADEIGCRLGELVGYSIRFEDITSPRTVLKYITDGLLVMECIKDTLFANYGCVILDEAHERTLHTDVLLGLLKKAIRIRPDLKVIITSATLDIKKFADYFGAPMVKIPGKVFPVDVEYLPSNHDPSNQNLPITLNPPASLRCRAQEPQYVRAAVEKVVSIHTAEWTRKGDILLFVPGKEEVEQACSILQKLAPDLMTLPIYAALPFETQCQIFSSTPQGVRKVVVATNIAETSITIDGVLYVVDTGLFKESVYNHGIDALRVTLISKAQAAQRAGRAGRTAPGKCYRLYMLEDYEKMNNVSAPAIHRTDFTSTALQLKAMGIQDIRGFGFMDPPKKDRVNHALHRLKNLGAIDRLSRITVLGSQMAEFPLMPNLSKILLTAASMQCSEEVLSIVSMLSVNHIFVRPKAKKKEADVAKTRFNDQYGDHMTLLNVFNEWKANGMSENWSLNNFINHKELEKALDIRKQLQVLLKIHAVPIVSAGRYLSNIRKALSTGEPNHVAYLESSRTKTYRTYVKNQKVYIHPSSALYKAEILPEYLIYHETASTTRTFMRTVSVCEGTWLPKLLSV